MLTYSNIENLNLNEKNILCDIMFKHGSDKSSLLKHHNYSLLYDKLFSPIKYNTINILEIGIGSINPNIPSNMCGGDLGKIYKPGASINGWLEYFPNATIYCCDIDKNILNFDNDRIISFHLDQTSEESINNALNTVLKDINFDIIIDDGLHWFPTNCNVMHKLLHKMKKNSYYIIEDIVYDQFNYSYLDINLLTNRLQQFIKLPNKFNNVDNNLFIVNS